ncbi:hypothetical protein EW026_g3359 [Hermanssonia centrifuga]|uniref:Uncharacterized protein n=1 Tax=Hermanssonia centrifuga TaxID=98765 RepID=A0A4S4KKE4_9APHY|nr:hypothetical protein EW026_g3359 [Hermanssonia centrifuga]
MSSPPSDDKAARRRELYMTIAEHVKVVSSLVTSLADGPINVPVLKGVADLVNKITDIAVTVNANMDDCDGLVKDISDYMKTIVDAFQGKDIAHLDQTFDGIMDAFQQELQKILGFVEKLSSRGTFKRVVMHARDKRKIGAFKDHLQHIFRNVNLANMIHVNTMLNNIESAVTEIHANLSITQAVGPTLDIRLTASLPNAYPLYGRDDMIHNAIAIVTSEQNTQHIAVLGQGGIGKTSVALSVLHDTKVKDYFKDNRFSKVLLTRPKQTLSLSSKAVFIISLQPCWFLTTLRPCTMILTSIVLRLCFST